MRSVSRRREEREREGGRGREGEGECGGRENVGGGRESTSAEEGKRGRRREGEEGGERENEGEGERAQWGYIHDIVLLPVAIMIIYNDIYIYVVIIIVYNSSNAEYTAVIL